MGHAISGYGFGVPTPSSNAREVMMTQTVGFIGLGIMGRPMARNLVKAGYQLVVHDVVQNPVQELVGAGARSASSPRDVASQVDVLVTMLPNSPDVELVALGPGGIIEGARSGLLYVDMSTIAPLVSQKVGAALAPKGVRMLDAPVSGGEKGAIDAALSIMVGGAKADFDAALPMFQVLGKTITLLGPLGAGGFTKLANQIIVAMNLTALGEALTLAKKAGLDRELTLKALGGGLAGSKCLEQKTPNYVAESYKPGFKIDLHYKDLGLITETGRALGVPLPCTALVQELFGALRVRGRGGLDHSAIITLIEDLAGIPPKS
jgi:2-hydroxy-3-oxopropionate reductase